MATTTHYTTAQNYSEYKHWITLRVSHRLTEKNNVKLIEKVFRTTRKIYQYTVLHGKYTGISCIYIPVKSTHSRHVTTQDNARASTYV